MADPVESNELPDGFLIVVLDVHGISDSCLEHNALGMGGHQLPPEGSNASLSLLGKLLLLRQTQGHLLVKRVVIVRIALQFQVMLRYFTVFLLYHIISVEEKS